MQHDYIHKSHQVLPHVPQIKPSNDHYVKPCGGAAKRAFDFVLALIAILLLSPLLLAVGLAVRLSDQGPALFGHTRIGYSGREFKCWKFRSMLPNSAGLLQDHLVRHPHAALEWKQNQKLTNDPRVTPLGQFLRTYSVDELPQLFNILSGDTSFVGPRPIECAERSKYGQSFRYYMTSRPGLTGLWQVSGRSHSTYQKRVAFEVAIPFRRELPDFARDMILDLAVLHYEISARKERHLTFIVTEGGAARSSKAVSQWFAAKNKDMAIPEGLEPSTC
jgi:exopolysaccharide production protein ExoY